MAIFFSSFFFQAFLLSCCAVLHIFNGSFVFKVFKRQIKWRFAQTVATQPRQLHYSNNIIKEKKNIEIPVVYVCAR